MLSDKEMLKITKGLLEIAENNKDKAFEEYSELISCMLYRDIYKVENPFVLQSIPISLLLSFVSFAEVQKLIENINTPQVLENLNIIKMGLGGTIFVNACVLSIVISSWKTVFKAKKHMKEHGVSSDVTVKDLSHLVDEKDISLRDCYSVINSLKSFMNDGKYEELFSKINESKGIYPVDFTNYVSELNKIWCEFLMEVSTVYASDLTSASRDIKRISLTSK